MFTVPTNIGVITLTWVGVPSALAPTISGAVVRGGQGMLGYGNIYLSLPSTSSSSTSSGGAVPVPVAAAIAGGAIGTFYSEAISVQGGTGPYTFSATGSVPPGLALSALTGTSTSVTGTPTTNGTYTFTITAIDSLGASGSQSFTIIIGASAGGKKRSYTFVS